LWDPPLPPNVKSTATLGTKTVLCRALSNGFSTVLLQKTDPSTAPEGSAGLDSFRLVRGKRGVSDPLHGSGSRVAGSGAQRAGPLAGADLARAGSQSGDGSFRRQGHPQEHKAAGLQPGSGRRGMARSCHRPNRHCPRFRR
jgi:hypothetical protein